MDVHEFCSPCGEWGLCPGDAPGGPQGRGAGERAGRKFKPGTYRGGEANKYINKSEGRSRRAQKSPKTWAGRRHPTLPVAPSPYAGRPQGIESIKNEGLKWESTKNLLFGEKACKFRSCIALGRTFFHVAFSSKPHYLYARGGGGQNKQRNFVLF